MIAQTHRAMQNLIHVLQEGGATLENVVRMTMWVVDAKLVQAKEIQAVRRDYFPRFVPPSATLGVSRLVDPRHLIEIDAMAIVG